MITAELSSARGIGKRGATILEMTQKNTSGAATLSARAEYQDSPRLLSIWVMLQFGDKARAAAKKFLS
jgi:hypothetical protein